MKNLVHGGDIYSYSEKMLDFSANINPLGMPEKIKQTIIDNIDTYDCYPDPLNRELTNELSKFHNIGEQHIVCGNGAADLIFRIVIAEKPQKALILSPTFAEYELALKQFNCEVDHHLMIEKEDFSYNRSFLNAIDKSYDIIFICNPNNPTGLPIKKELILEIIEKCEKFNITLVIDECFCDFIDKENLYSIIPEMPRLKNIIVLKAFTKMYAMAGIRLGYALCSNVEMKERIHGTLQPWAVSTVASKCGIAALNADDFIHKTTQYVTKNRKFLIDELTSLGFKTYNSETNYVFFKAYSGLVDALKKYNILIRSCSNYISLNDNYYRVAVRNMEDNIKLIEAIKLCKN